MPGNPRTLATIRTHRWDEDAARLCQQLQPVFSDDLAVIFHNRPTDVTPPIRVADINDDWLQAHGLRAVKDWGWRCGDYFHYRARAAFPEYDHYWMIEPDVFFAGPLERFFAEAAALPQDVLGVQLSPVKVLQRFGRGMPAMPLYRSIFALTRFSATALDWLFALRKDYSGQRVAQRFFANDEIFCFSHAMASPDLTCESLFAALPQWVDPKTLATDPDVLLELLEGRHRPGVFHPVRGRASFLQSVAARIAQNTHFVAEIRPSLACLSDADLDGIAADAAARCLEILRRERAVALTGHGVGQAAPVFRPGNDLDHDCIHPAALARDSGEKC